MKPRSKINLLFFILCCMAPLFGKSQNPIVQTIYTADPAPLVHNDTLYLYTGHDEDKSTWFTMKDWRCFSTTDMLNWTDRGAVLSLKNFSWAGKDAWAGQCIFRNGKFYWYVPVNQANGKGMALGVAVSPSPTGPFTDALGKPLIHSGNGDIDPTVFIDDDGQAYLYWGNPYLKYVKLNKDMISYAGDIITVPLNKEGFNVRFKDADKRQSAYEEGPWLYKRKALYYMLYAAGGVPEHLAYSTAPTPTGPWLYRDTIMSVIQKGGAFTNHPGLVDYKGKSYLFYHNGALPGGGGFTRSVAVEECLFDENGAIIRMLPSEGIQKAAGRIDPFKRVEAETIAWEEGIETEKGIAADADMYVTSINHGDYIKVRNLDFKKSPKEFHANIAAVSAARIEIRMDSLTGKLLGTCEIKSTGGMENWSMASTKVDKVEGLHDIYFVFKGGTGDLFHFNWWKFK